MAEKPAIGIVLGEGGSDDKPPASERKPMAEEPMADEDKAARVDALREFFEMGQAGDYEGADQAWADYKALCKGM